MCELQAPKWVSLDEGISRLVNGEDGLQLEVAFLEIMTSDAAVNFNMLDAFMEDVVISNVNSTAIIIIKRSSSRLWSIQVNQEPLQAMW